MDTHELKRFCTDILKADLVGVADIGRCEHAPPRMSPQGIMPTARSVIVMAIHHPDACIELGGKTHPQEIGPYRVQYRMNQRLDEMSFRLANRLEADGHRAVPIFSSNSWRYRGYQEMTEQFAPDVSHMHLACAAGLAEFGYQGLAITPQYGARQRWVTVITDAIFDPNPLLEPGSVCDGCMLCRKHCRSQALTKEIDGWNEVPIANKVYRYARKNLWRCSWGEHFDLDLDLDLPEKVDAAAIEKALTEHGPRGGEMGSCLRHCLPKERRVWDRAYTDAPRRRRDVGPGDIPVTARLVDELPALALARCADGLAISAIEGGAMDAFLPGAVRGVTVVLRIPQADMPAKDDTVERILAQAVLDLTRRLERDGWDAICETDHDEGFFRNRIDADDTPILTRTVLTCCPLPVKAPILAPSATVDDDLLSVLIQEAGAVVEGLVHGVAEAAILETTAAALRPHWTDQRNLDATNRLGWKHRFGPMDPIVEERPVQVSGPDALLPGARRVLVLGLPLPAEAVACTVRPPAEAPGPMALLQYESQVLLRLAAWRVVRALEAAGHRAAVSQDLLGTASLIGNPRGPQPDAFANRFAAVAAGLARLGRCGNPVHPAHGTNARFIAIVTDTDLPVDAVLGDEARPACEGCSACLDACPVGAFREEIAIPVDGTTERFHPIDRARCDWSKRYSLVKAEGTAYLGWSLDRQPPQQITAAVLADNLRHLPAIERHRPCNFEACVLACPQSRGRLSRTAPACSPPGAAHP